MRVLMTGISSFSGYYFAKSFLERDHEVIGILSGGYSSNSLKERRIKNLVSLKKSLSFLNLRDIKSLRDNNFEVLILHGSHMKDRKSPEFNSYNAVQKTLEVSRTIKENGVFANIIHTGTFSEPYESLYDDPVSFNTYSTSKSEIYVAHKELFSDNLIHKYVMPNPIGKLQNYNLISAAFEKWQNDEAFQINQPWLIRDFVPVDLLAEDYVLFTEDIVKNRTRVPKKRYPSLYITTIEGIIKRVASVAQSISNLNCEVIYGNRSDTVFEPRIRINRDILYANIVEWNETKWWNEYASSMLRDS